MHKKINNTLNGIFTITIFLFALLNSNSINGQNKQLGFSDEIAMDPNFPVDAYHFGENKMFYWFAGQNVVQLILKKNYQKTLDPNTSGVTYIGFLDGSSYFSTDEKIFYYNSKTSTEGVTEINAAMLPKQFRYTDQSPHASWNYDQEITSGWDVGILVCTPEGFKMYSLSEDHELKTYSVLRTFYKPSPQLDSASQLYFADAIQMSGQYMRIDGEKLLIFDFSCKNTDIQHVSEGRLEIRPYPKSQASFLQIDINKSQSFTKTYLQKIFQTGSKQAIPSQIGIPSFVQASVKKENGNYILILINEETKHTVFRPLPKNGDTTKFNKYNASIALNKGGWAEITKDENGVAIVKFYAFTIGDNAVANSMTLADFKKQFYDPK
ncbi:hypothetical protein BH11BAC6_BH11BAC6_06090 [soil metagenome]